MTALHLKGKKNWSPEAFLYLYHGILAIINLNDGIIQSFNKYKYN